MIISKKEGIIKEAIITGYNYKQYQDHLLFLTNKKVKLINKSINSPIVLFYDIYLAHIENSIETIVDSAYNASHLVYDTRDFLTKNTALYRIPFSSEVRVLLLDDNPNDFGYLLPK